jgi:hypothetical protein
VTARALVAVTACALALSTLAGCAKPYDYTNFRQHHPRSILVMLPQNESREADGAWSYQSTVTRPLAERGYYVFPVAVVDRLMKDDGVSPSKAAEIIGADAVLYVTLEEYSTKHQVLNAATLVKLRGRLVDVRSGLLLWERRFAIQRNSNLGSGGILGDSREAAHKLAGPANVRFFGDRDQGLLYGPYHPRYGKDD